MKAQGPTRRLLAWRAVATLQQHKVERLVNLLMLLLSTRRPVSVDQIRQLMPEFYDQPDVETFRRMFERDKDELRELGVPIDMAPLDEWDVAEGYHVPRTAYELPPVELEPDEAAAVALAARFWRSAGLADANRSAWLKLRAAGIAAEPVGGAVVEPRVEARDHAFEPLLTAVNRRQPVAFDYLAANAVDPQRRTVEPWGLVHRRGRWYLVGHDRDRDALRVFRLTRIRGAVSVVGPERSVRVPDGVDLSKEVSGFADQPVQGTAEVRVRSASCWELRRLASAESGSDDEWTLLQIPYADLESLAAAVVACGGDAVAIAPAGLRTIVVDRLRGLAASPR